MKIAMYWDFENIHASLCTIKFGPTWYRQNLFTKQPHLVDINSIMEYVAGLGDVNINKAYANWTYLYPYSFDLQNHAIDLIQLFPRGRNGKNGADIRMAIEIIEDMTLNTHIDTIVAVGGDSDYISIAQKVRQKGRHIIGIGAKETTNQYWIKSCNEFKFYSSLLVKASSIENFEDEGYEEGDLEDARQLLCRAIAGIFAQTGENRAKKAAIKPMMLRLDPSFDETNYGYKSFSEFLDRCSDLILITQGEFDHIVTFRANGCTLPLTPLTPMCHTYERILKKQQIRLLDAGIIQKAVLETYHLFQEKKAIQSYSDYRERITERLKKTGIHVTDTDISKIKTLLYKAFSFMLDTEHSTISLADDIQSETDLLERVHRMLIKRILDNVDDDPDVEFLSGMLYGDQDHADDVYLLIADYNNIAENI